VISRPDGRAINAARTNADPPNIASRGQQERALPHDHRNMIIGNVVSEIGHVNKLGFLPRRDNSLALPSGHLSAHSIRNYGQVRIIGAAVAAAAHHQRPGSQN